MTEPQEIVYTVITRYDSEARNCETFRTLAKAKAWGKAQLEIGWRVNNASLFSSESSFKTLHASWEKEGKVRWMASKL